MSPRAVGPVKGGTLADRLIVPKHQQTAADSQVDRAFDELSEEPARKTMQGIAAPQPLPLPPLGEDTEVTIEADEPPQRDQIAVPLTTKKARAIGDNSEPEISIERFVELEVEEPMNERDDSAPEIMILTPGRAITADDTKLVSGSIESKKR